MHWLLNLFLISLTAYAAPAMAEPDWRAGRAIFKQCKACHSFKPGDHRFGPSLAGLFERKAGTAEGFNYSKAMRTKGAAGLMWSDADLDAYLAKPNAFIPRTKMAFPGLSRKQDRDNVIAYVKRRAKAKR